MNNLKDMDSIYTPRVSLKKLRTTSLLGRIVRVKCEVDIGANDCILVEKITEGKITANTEFRGFFFDGKGLYTFSADQIIDIGGYITIKHGRK